MNTKTKQNIVISGPKAKVPPFYISLENHYFTLHNCLVDSRATKNIMPFFVMESLGMECTKYYEICEIICAMIPEKYQPMVILIILIPISILYHTSQQYSPS
jgi:hypothetical protein